MTNLPLEKLQSIFGSRLQEFVDIDDFTSTRVGRPAAGFLSINNSAEMEHALKALW